MTFSTPTPDFVNYAASVRTSGDVPVLCALQHLNLYVLCFSDDGPDTSTHPISQEELRAAFNPSDGMEWNVATIEPDRIQTS